MSIYLALDDPRGVAWSLDLFAGLLAAEGQAEPAALMWGASDGLLSRVGGALVPTIGWIRERHIGPAAAAIGDGRFERARRAGREMAVDEVIALARRAEHDERSV